MLVIDGSQGEGGGQILRSALSLSLLTGQPFRLINVRHNRDKPGLRPQHLAAVRAACDLGQAEVSGDAVGAAALTFVPRLSGSSLPAGHYRFNIGTAGSAPLVLQTVLPVLLRAAAPSTVTIVGGTYNPKAPPVDYLQRVLAPLLDRMGPHLEVFLDRPGFYPAGGGQIRAHVTPSALRPLTLHARGQVVQRRATALLARLPRHIGEREVATLADQLGWPAECFAVQQLADTYSPGNVVLVEIHSEHITELFSGVGERGVPAEKVAASVARDVKDYLLADVPVGPHLADQLLLPMAMAGGGSLRTLAPTLHTLTQVEVVQRFLDVRITITQESAHAFRIDLES